MDKKAKWSLFHDAIGNISANKLERLITNYDIDWLFSADYIELKNKVI